VLQRKRSYQFHPRWGAKLRRKPPYLLQSRAEHLT
jgi:hypothetical protein